MIPRPPPSGSTADFIVTVFVIMVAVILVLLTVAGILIAVFTDDDVGALFRAVTDLVATVIAALAGFLAGRKNGRDHPPGG